MSGRSNKPKHHDRPRIDRPRILVADDDRWLLESMAEWLGSLGYQVQSSSSIAHAKNVLAHEAFDVLLCDVRFDDGDGLNLLRFAHKKSPAMPVLMMSGYAGPDTACEAIAAGAFDFLSKPIIDQELQAAIDRAIQQQRIQEENSLLKQQLDRRFGMDNVVSHDWRMLKIFEMLESVADARATILITGENGTGKSMIARAVHRKSSRRNAPFVEVACGALPDTLLESELFGHVAGAFTGAASNKIGKFQQAHGGTLFLDEIGTATAALQVKLLRALQELQFEPLGGNETISVDTRAILATNENLEQSVAEGRFRQDLYYRINVIRIELPSLRERIDDIPILAQHFLARACQEYQREVDGFTSLAMQAMMRYRWPGNIRELENTVQRAVLLSKNRQIDSDLLPQAIQGTASLPSAVLSSSVPIPSEIPHPSRLTKETENLAPWRIRTLSEALEEPERNIILEALRANDWNRNSTADQLGINRTTLYKKMLKLGITSVEPTPSQP